MSHRLEKRCHIWDKALRHGSVSTVVYHKLQNSGESAIRAIAELALKTWVK